MAEQWDNGEDGKLVGSELRPGFKGEGREGREGRCDAVRSTRQFWFRTASFHLHAFFCSLSLFSVVLFFSLDT